VKTSYALQQIRKYGTVEQVRPGAYLARVGSRQARFLDRDGQVAEYPRQHPYGDPGEAASTVSQVDLGNGADVGLSFEVGARALDPAVLVTVRLRTSDPVACEMARGITTGETPVQVLVDFLKDRGLLPS
jgi:hypothetical protein